MSTSCVTWGPLDETGHMDCVVVVTGDTVRNVIPEMQAGPLPRVCPCECSVCKRAWWAQGRPRLVDGKVVRA